MKTSYQEGVRIGRELVAKGALREPVETMPVPLLPGGVKFFTKLERRFENRKRMQMLRWERRMALSVLYQ